MKNPMILDRMLGDAAARARDSNVIAVLAPASDIADQWPLFGLRVGTAAIGIARRNRTLATTGVRMTLSMLAATMLKNVVKNRVDRTRPFVVADGSADVFQTGTTTYQSLTAFPPVTPQALLRSHER